MLLFAIAAYVRHCIQAFNRRSLGLDNDLCRLALFLDPRYRMGATSQLDMYQLFQRVILLAYELN